MYLCAPMDKISEIPLSDQLEAIDTLDPKQFIIIKRARVNNLKNLSVAIPRNQLVVITGLSGSGKSSLAFDTLFAEGQRMYVESLSSYARQFLGRMEKPEVDYIRGVAPAIAIEQRVNTRNPRSTVGTTTEIYDYLKLLFARVGKTYSPETAALVSRDSVSDVVDYTYEHQPGEKVLVCCPLIVKEGRDLEQELKVLLQKGFTRVMADREPAFIEELLDQNQPLTDLKFSILIDRLVIEPEREDNQFRLADSIQTAFYEGEGVCTIEIVGKKPRAFSDRFERDGITFEEPSVNLFSFNNPYGACKTCEGFGKILGIDPDLVIPDKNLSLYDGAVAPWRSETMKKWLKPLLENAAYFDFPIHRSYNELTEDQQNLIWHGARPFKGIDQFFKFLGTKTHKIQYRVLLSRYRGRTVCPECLGSRLRKDASYVKIQSHSITDLVLMPVDKVKSLFESLRLDSNQQTIARRILIEIENRLKYLSQVGLGYLTLNRLSSTLSGGEFQRIKLATSLGSALVGSMYILDEPSIGLHPRDTHRLIEVLKTLRDLGNTVIVVEHEEEVMRAANQIIDVGPGAGSHGGQLVFQGNLDQIARSESFTGKYLSGKESIDIPSSRRKWKDSITIVGARQHNLKNLTVKFPLDTLTAVTGVSGSGKSTLISQILYPALAKIVGGIGNETTGRFDRLEGDYQKVTQVEFVNQNPIGKSSRSNPVTYVKAYDAIRELFSLQPMAKQRGYKPASFSFNVDGGRCEECQGEGIVKIEMQFMADIQLTCESCNGQRFKKEILDIEYHGKNIAEVLDLTVEESMDFFKEKSAILKRMAPLQAVGLGYVRLGQASNSLSGGEAQRVKLASFLGKNKTDRGDHVLFIFDEPTTGLHFHDIKTLLKAINALIEQGNSVIVIEHNIEVIKSADWVIDLGPEGGDQGGTLCFSGTPEKLITNNNNHTAQYLKEKF